jgi:hypothetical protein
MVSWVLFSEVPEPSYSQNTVLLMMQIAIASQNACKNTSLTFRSESPEAVVRGKNGRDRGEIVQ